tara:strand:+ start:173 stop:358 length:186 start_codon:yes stop_codon:yes gene_type:complete
MSGVQILLVINMKLQAVKLGTVRIYFLKKKRILNTVRHAEGSEIEILIYFYEQLKKLNEQR